ncbi:MAG TPA: DUF1893 domain-containing protein [Candidatus Bacteroides pullicola]|uniref:DUF1893 domain-containing protein n=1 Tax=Candidatus Bacteroides pullicola TaxID=2838475 RepID=A0A9D2CL75_9BACE|nr:DUF1893 domain-containing protein [Candidatus Bacteroides pullicola]
MMEKTDIISLLHAEGCSCVIRKGTETRIFHRRGVIDLFELYENDPAFMNGARLADKVIGKGAAALVALGGMAEVYADIISTPALNVLRRAGIPVRFGQEVPHIINRKKDGRCPLETACDGLDTPEEMLPAIRKFVEGMSRL